MPRTTQLVTEGLTGLTDASALLMFFLLPPTHHMGVTYGYALGLNGVSTSAYATVPADANAADPFRLPTIPDPLVVVRTRAVSANPKLPTMLPWVVVPAVTTHLPPL